MFAKVIDAINVQNVRVENLRILLVKQGVFSDAEFDAELVETQCRWTQQFSEMIAKATADGTALIQQQLLRSHRGKPQ